MALCKKIIVLGESGVGKTSLLKRFCLGTFRVNQASTSIDRLSKDISIQGQNVTLELWDTGGQERFRNAVSLYYRRAHGVLLVYDVNDFTSFKKLSSWLKELREINETAVVLIVGNKAEDPDRKTVNRTEIRNYARQEGLDYVETSAKNNHNVNEAFELLMQKLLDLEHNEEVENDFDVIRLEDSAPSAKYNFIQRCFPHLPPIVPLPLDITPLQTNLPKKPHICSLL